MAKARQLRFLSFEFQIRLAQGEADARAGDAASARLELQKLGTEAARAGFRLIARKAASAAKTGNPVPSAKRKG